MAYSLATHYAGQALLDGFSFFTGSDPSHGFVDYQNQSAALSQGLVSVNNNRVRLGVDSVNNYTIDDVGRPSVRLTSYQGFTHGLFIADFAHMPASTCGAWPAFWAFNNADNGKNWPLGGEVDIIEGVNTAQRNLISAHTSPGCQLPSNGFSGEQGSVDCGPGPGNIGCNYAAPTSDTTSYGDSFNAEGGGVYAMEWDSDGLKVWHFARSTVPGDIALAPMVVPDPKAWGPPAAVFGGDSCDADSFFYNMSLVININLCGDYAANVWGVADQCNTLAPTCQEWVAGHPEAFLEAFWDINYIDYYRKPVEADPPVFPNQTSISTTATPFSNITASATALPTNASLPTPVGTITLTTVVPSAVPTNGGQGTSNPARIQGLTLLGCFGPGTGNNTWSVAADLPTMDNEACVASCAGKKYAGSFGTTCYCADSLGGSSAVANSQCDRPCPGNAREFCGGEAKGLSFGSKVTGPFVNSTTDSTTKPTMKYRRAAPENILLTVYGDLSQDAPPPGAPAMGGNGTLDSEGSGGPEGGSGRPIERVTSVVTVTSAVTVTYTTVCATDPAKLVAIQYCTTMTMAGSACLATAVPSGAPFRNAAVAPYGNMTDVLLANGTSASFDGTSLSFTNGTRVPHLNSTNVAYTDSSVVSCRDTTSGAIVAPGAAIAAVPMSTITQSCSACGPQGEDTVTLTVPAAVMTAGLDVIVTAIKVATVVPLNMTLNMTETNGTMPSARGVAQLPPTMDNGGNKLAGEGVDWGCWIALCLGMIGTMMVL